jgi:predicted aspartyl protease
MRLTGRIDEYGRALLPIVLKHPSAGTSEELEAWIETAFTSSLMLPLAIAVRVGLGRDIDVPTKLADGSEKQMSTVDCLIDWFGEWKKVMVISSDVKLPLLGIGLLEDHELTINYRTLAVSLV